MRVQLEIEGFFAKILLDKDSRAVEFYFGPLRGCALNSHDVFTKRLEVYAEQKGLVVPDHLPHATMVLKKEISDFRDHQISHEKSPRTVKGLGWRADLLRMVVTHIYPTENDQQAASRELDYLLVDLDAYLASIIDFVRANRARSHLQLAAGIE